MCVCVLCLVVNLPLGEVEVSGTYACCFCSHLAGSAMMLCAFLARAGALACFFTGVWLGSGRWGAWGFVGFLSGSLGRPMHV